MISETTDYNLILATLKYFLNAIYFSCTFIFGNVFINLLVKINFYVVYLGFNRFYWRTDGVHGLQPQRRRAFMLAVWLCGVVMQGARPIHRLGAGATAAQS
jgi:hypothetical protein